MDFNWSEKQEAIQREMFIFAASLPGGQIERDRQGAFARENWQACADHGIHGMAVPKAYGGTEQADILDSMLVMEAMGKGCADMGLLFAMNAHMWTVQLPILHFSTEKQKRRFLPRMCSGEWIGAHAVTEPNTGSDMFALETIAEKCEGGYRLNGTKRLVTLAPIADVALVYGTIDPSKGKWGVTTFLVEGDRPGFRVGPTDEKMGLRTVPFGEIYLEDCVVPEENLLGKPGGGFALSQASMEYERCCILASQVGAMERQLDKAVEFARERKQFGQAIGKFQSVSNRIADMKMRIETARLLLYKTAWLKQQGESAMM